MLGARQEQQAVDELRQPAHLGECPLDVVGLVVLPLGLEVLEAQPERGQGRAELVGGVRDERLLRAQHRLEPPGGRVERTGETVQLGRVVRYGHPHPQVSLAETGGRSVELGERLRERPGQQHTHQEDGEGDHARQAQE